MDKFFEALPLVASHPLALVAYLALIIAWFVIALQNGKAKEIGKQIKDLPEKDRLKRIQLEYKTAPRAGLSAVQWLRARMMNLILMGFAMTLFTIIVLAGFVVYLASHALSVSQFTSNTTQAAETALPTPTTCFLCPRNGSASKLILCSRDSSEHAGVRVIARWLAEEGKKGFFVDAHGSLDIDSVRFWGWNSRMDGKQFFLEDKEGIPESNDCGYEADWVEWWEPNAMNPVIGSTVTVEFINSVREVKATVKLKVAKSEIILDSFRSEP